MLEVELNVRDLQKAQAKMEQMAEDVTGTPMVNAVRDAVLIIQRSAKQNAPVDTGRLRSSIVPEIRARERSVTGIVGSNVMYAPYVEFGTRPHWPPRSALEVWARRHGTTAYLVARAISRRGTKAVRFLQRAVEDNERRIHQVFERAGRRILEK
jgi:HK97 gp10 family phage protein